MAFNYSRYPASLFCIVFPVCVLSTQSLPAQPTSLRYSSTIVPLSALDSVYALPNEFIVENSETLLVDSLLPLQRKDDYEIDWRYGKIHISSKGMGRIFVDSASHVLWISYRSLSLAFKKQYSLREISVRRDSTGTRTFAVKPSAAKANESDYFGPGLQKSGSLARGFTVGSNRDFSLNSGFRMQMAGKLSRDVDVVAALTDENSPIQPEGTTQTLREVDKVFIELKSTNYGATLGDFNVQVGQSEGGEFARFFRKVQGAQGTAKTTGVNSFTQKANLGVTAAASRGKFHSNQIQGNEGTQGPYRLTGQNGEQRIIVVAGSERVYLNGELMTRGDINDYTIEYGSGDVTFTSRRLITNVSRITIDFEYSDRQFTRNLLAGTTSFTGFNNALNFNAVFIQEADDPASPIDVPLDEGSLNILSQSGGDRLKASLSGIKFVGRDTATNTGRGQYLLRDSTINGRTYPIIAYAPGDSLALYTVTFSQVNQMPKDSAGYVRVGIGQFRFAGVGVGNYLPLQFLPMPQLQRVLGLNARVALSSDFTMTGEYAASNVDVNRLSTLDDQNRSGNALTFEARYNPARMQLAGVNLGSLDLRFSERFVEKRFVSPDRYNEVEFGRKWNVESISSSDEEIREASVQYAPSGTVRWGGTYGYLSRTGEQTSNRLQTELNVLDAGLPFVKYRLENIKSSNSVLSTQSSWLRQLGDLEYAVWGLKPGVGYENEDRSLRQDERDSLHTGSFRFTQISPRLLLPELGRLTMSGEVQFRTEDSARDGSVQRAFSSITQIYSLQLSEWKSLTSSLNLSIRNSRFTSEFKQRRNSDAEIILVRSVSRYGPFDRAVEAETYYEFSSQRSSRLERAFIRVARGSGNYRYRGDINGNTIADDDEFELTRFDGDFVSIYVPSDQLYPVVDLKTSLRLRLQPARLFSASGSGVERLLRAISTETYVRIDEKSREPDVKQIYLMNFRRFQNDETTIAGSNQLTQDIHVFEHHPDLSFRFRFGERTGMVQLVGVNERSYQKERSVRVRSQLVREIGNQTDYANKIDRVSSTGSSLRVRDLTSDVLTTDFSYRPQRELEIGFVLGVSRIVDQPQSNATADINEQALRAVYALYGSGQLRGEVRREEVVLSNVVIDPFRPMPYEFTAGKAIGKSILWQLAFDCRISQNIQVTLNYSGRSEGDRPFVHLARAEARAFF